MKNKARMHTLKQALRLSLGRGELNETDAPKGVKNFKN